MANICNNIMYVSSDSEDNIQTVLDFFKDWDADIDENDSEIDIYFDSKWTFPLKEMNKLYELIPNKEDIYMRCLSYEFGCLYHELWICDKDGWKTV